MHAPAVVEAALHDWRSAPVSEKARAMLGFLEALNQRPESVGPREIEGLRAQGLSDAAIESALLVAFGFEIITRLADALRFPLPSAEGIRRATENLLRRGYGTGSIPEFP